MDTAPAAPETQRLTWHQGVRTLTAPGRWCRAGPYVKHPEPLNQSHEPNYSTDPQRNKHHDQTKHTQKRTAPQHCSVEELRTTVQTVASSFEHSSQNVRHLGQKMVAATEMITDRVDENAQALVLLAEVVDKLQGIIVANKHLVVSPPCRPKLHRSPVPPPRGSSLSPTLIHKPPTPYPCPVSASSASSSSSSSASSCSDGFMSPKSSNSGTRIKKLAGGGDVSGQVWFKNGPVSRAHQQDRQDYNGTGCLKIKKKK